MERPGLVDLGYLTSIKIIVHAVFNCGLACGMGRCKYIDGIEKDTQIRGT